MLWRKNGIYVGMEIMQGSRVLICMRPRDATVSCINKSLSNHNYDNSTPYLGIAIWILRHAAPLLQKRFTPTSLLQLLLFKNILSAMDMPFADATQGHHASSTCEIDIASHRLSLRTLMLISLRDAKEGVARSVITK